MESKPDLNLLYKRLVDAVKAENDEEILRLATQVLQETPQDSEIMFFQALALLRLGKLNESLQIMKSIKNFSDPFQLYTLCYCLYKKGDFPVCLEKINTAEKSAFVGFQLLEAQIYYKQEKFDEAFKIYQSLLEKSQVSDENFEDFLVNMLSSGYYANMTFQDKALKIAESFLSKRKDIVREVLFNLSLLYANVGQYEVCFSQLKKFTALVEEEGDQQSIADTLMANLEKDSIESLIYNLTPEQIDEKIKYYSGFEGKENLDPSVKTVLLNNLAVFRSHGTHFHLQDSLKNLDSVVSSLKNVGKAQEISIKLNKVLVSLHKNRLVEAQKMLTDLESSYNKEDLRKNSRYISSKFYLLYKGKNFKGIENLFQDFSSNKALRPLCLLIKAEISRLLKKNQETFVSLSDLIQDNSELLKNDVFAIIVLSLISQLPKESSHLAQTILDFLRKNSKDTEIQTLLGAVYEKREDFPTAATIYEGILSRIPESESSNNLIYKLLRCYSVFDSNKAENLLTKIQLPGELITEEREIKRLLDKEAGFMSSKAVKVPGSPRSPKSSDEILKKPIKKHKKKIRLPKNFDPSKPGPMPDPERWMPLYMRSKFKGKKGKKGMRGAQGEVTGKETVSNYKGTASTANQEVVTSKKSTKSKKKRK